MAQAHKPAGSPGGTGGQFDTGSNNGGGVPPTLAAPASKNYTTIKPTKAKPGYGQVSEEEDPTVFHRPVLPRDEAATKFGYPATPPLGADIAHNGAFLNTYKWGEKNFDTARTLANRKLANMGFAVDSDGDVRHPGLRFAGSFGRITPSFNDPRILVVSGKNGDEAPTVCVDAHQAADAVFLHAGVDAGVGGHQRAVADNIEHDPYLTERPKIVAGGGRDGGLQVLDHDGNSYGTIREDDKGDINFGPDKTQIVVTTPKGESRFDWTDKDLGSKVNKALGLKEQAWL